VKLGRVVGTVVSTINHPSFDERTLLLCDLLDPSGRPSGGYLIAVDSVGAGAGETVLLLDEGTSARQVLGAPGAPIRTVVVGIVDAVIERQAVAGPAVADGPAVEGSAPRGLAVQRPVGEGKTGEARPERRR
jgi:ethanolamine utilization protein EutN